MVISNVNSHLFGSCFLVWFFRNNMFGVWTRYLNIEMWHRKGCNYGDDFFVWEGIGESVEQMTKGKWSVAADRWLFFDQVIKKSHWNSLIDLDHLCFYSSKITELLIEIQLLGKFHPTRCITFFFTRVIHYDVTINTATNCLPHGYRWNPNIIVLGVCQSHCFKIGKWKTHFHQDLNK